MEIKKKKKIVYLVKELLGPLMQKEVSLNEWESRNQQEKRFLGKNLSWNCVIEKVDFLGKINGAGAATICNFTLVKIKIFIHHNKGIMPLAFFLYNLTW